MISEELVPGLNISGEAAARKRVVALEGVTKIFRAGKARVTALSGVDLEIRSGEFLTITGPSGSGKTTLLNLIACLDHPSSGSLEIDGHRVASLSPNALANLRSQKMGLIFQSFNLIPVLTVGENVEYPLLLNKDRPRARERRARVVKVLSDLGIDSMIDRRPNELSGGECQRVAVARALINGPRIVLADEPTSNLDSRTGASLLRLMKSLHERDGITFVFSTHDAGLVEWAERVVELRDGEIVHDRAR